MKKIGILFGRERTFPEALIEHISNKAPIDVKAERVLIDKVVQAGEAGYAVIVDRISQDIPFYRVYLKNAVLNGTIVINNPFWWSADDKFFNNCLAEKMGVPIPRTVLLPSKEHPPDTTSDSMSNLAYPLDWDGIFNYVGFPAFMKPYVGGGWKHVYKLNNREEFFRAYDKTGQLVMMLQEAIEFTEYYRCYCVDGRDVHIMPYDPRQPFQKQYGRAYGKIDKALYTDMEEAVLVLNRALGYDFNTVELAVRQAVPYAIDFCNPAPDADYHSVGEENFKWVVQAVAEMCLRKVERWDPKATGLSWGGFVHATIRGRPYPDLKI